MKIEDIKSGDTLHGVEPSALVTMVEPTGHANHDLPDDIVEAIRAARRTHAAAFGFDVARIVADLRKKDAASGDPLVSLPPKPARHRRVAAGESGDGAAMHALCGRR